MKHTLVCLALLSLALTVNAAPFAATEIAADPSQIELLLIPWEETPTENVRIKAGIRNISGKRIDHETVFKILHPVSLQVTNPKGEVDTVEIAGWYGARPRHLDHGEAWVTASTYDLNNKPVHFRSDGLYLLQWVIGENRSNVIPCQVAKGIVSRLPTLFNVTETYRSKEKQGIAEPLNPSDSEKGILQGE